MPQTSDAAAIYAQFEEACLDFQVPATRAAGEHVLTSFRQLPKVLPICQYILSRAESPMVQFQVALAIGEVSIRDYTFYAHEDLVQLKNYMLEYCMQREKLPKYVRDQILLAVSLITKRSLLDMPDADKESIYLHIKQLMDMGGSSAILGAALANAMIDQFSSTKSSTVGLSWEFHNKCKVFFETHIILPILQQALTKLHDTVSSCQYISSPPPALLVELLELLEKIFQWEFDSTNADHVLPGSFSRTGIDYDNFDKEDGPTSAKRTFTIFPRDWQPVVGNSDVLWLFFRTYSLVQSDDVLGHRCRQCLVQLAGFKEDFFDHDSSAVQNYANTMIHGTLKVVSDIVSIGSSPDALTEQGPQMLGTIQMVRRLLENLSLSVLCSVPEFFQYLNEVGRLTVSCLRATVSDLDEGWIINVIQPADGSESEIKSKLAQSNAENLIQYMKTVAYQIVETYIGTRLERAKLVLEDEEEEDEIDSGFKDWQLLHEKSEQLKGYFVDAGRTDQTLILLHEQLHWITLITAHILADAGKGEQPMIPDSLMLLSGSQSFEQDQVTSISRQFLELFRFLSSFGANTVEASNCSPRVAETLIWFMERWCKSYLLVDENEYGYMSPNIAKSFGRSGPSEGQGLHIIDFFIEQMKANFMLWNADPDVLQQIIQWLNTCGTSTSLKKGLLESSRFPDLVQFVTNNMQQLPEAVHNSLIQTVVTISSGASDMTVRESYFDLIFTMVENCLTYVLQSPNFTQEFQQVNVMNQVLNALEMFDGLALASQFNNTQSIFGFCSRFFESFLQLMSIYKNVAEVQLQILQLFEDLAGRLDFSTLHAEQKQLLFHIVAEILGSFGAANQGKKRLHTQEEENDRPYADISTVLVLLFNIMASEFEDFNKQSIGTSSTAGSSDVADVVLYGVNIVIPMIDMEMLKIPSLCQQYIRLIAHLIEFFPEKLAGLPSELLNNLMASLEYGISHDITDINISTLHAVAPLALWAHTQEQNNANVEFLKPALKKFLGQLLNMLLFQHLDTLVVDGAAETLLALVCAQRDEYMGLVNQVIGQQSPHDQARLLHAFQKLDEATPKQLPPTIPPSRNAVGFKEAFLDFLMDVRAVLRVK
ncbi:Exportin-4 [Apophysomyces sp. BC1034]|nr:Exportin-4 [Apophysomyces sp. BC1021]KAG0190036.1 Exportin-4 [Apophysomyces sp. BC1034]